MTPNSDGATDDARLAGLPATVVELSGDVTVFDASRAVSETQERQDPLYWVDLDVAPEWLVVGDNGQGDEWWLGPRGDIWFFDHTDGERSRERFVPMHLGLTDWIIVGHMLGAHERADSPDPRAGERIAAAMDAISPELSDRWPYDLF